MNSKGSSSVLRKNDEIYDKDTGFKEILIEEEDVMDQKIYNQAINQASLAKEDPELSLVILINLLQTATLNGDLATVNLLLQQNPTLGQHKCTKLITPLWLAVLYDHYEIAIVLVDHGSDVNDRLDNHAFYDRESTLLHVLALGDCLPLKQRLVERILDHGADPNAQDSKGHSILHVAAMMGRVELVMELLRYGANPNVVNCEGETVLHLAAQSRGVEVLVPLLIGYGADSMARDNNGMNALHYLAKSAKQSVKMAELLIDEGVSLNDLDRKNHFQPVHYAISSGKEYLVRFFLACGADVNFRTKSDVTLLHLAAKNNNHSLTLMLLKCGADVNIKTKFGRTALHSACYNLRVRNILLLLEYNADINVKDNDDKTAFSLIEYKNMNQCIRSMVKHIAKLQAANYPVNEDDMDIIREYPKIKAFYRDCTKEITRMKENKFYHNTSFYDILMTPQSTLAMLTKNADLVEAFYNFKLKGLLSIFGKDLTDIFKRAEKRRDKEMIIKRDFDILFEDLPNDIIDKILFYEDVHKIFFL